MFIFLNLTIICYTMSNPGLNLMKSSKLTIFFHIPGILLQILRIET